MTIKNSDLIIIAVVILVILFLYYSQNEKFTNTPSFIINNDNNITAFFINNPPVALYIADIADKINSNQLINLYNKDKNATIRGNYQVINGSTKSLPYIVGTTSTSITFPNVLMDNYTIVAITKFNDKKKNGTILINGNNYINAYGHYGGDTGIVFVSGRYIVTSKNTKKKFNITDPLVTCIRVSSNNENFNNTNSKYDVILNNTPMGGLNNYRPKNENNTQRSLFINTNDSSKSDFSFSILCVFPKFLSDNDMQFVSNIFNTLLKDPSLLVTFKSLLS
jgi:hypothetical protein